MRISTEKRLFVDLSIDKLLPAAAALGKDQEEEKEEENEEEEERG